LAHSFGASPVCTPTGYGAAGAVPPVAFGRTGGNIRPVATQIFGDGTVIYAGSAAAAPTYKIQPDAVLGLKRLAQAEGFASWPATFSGKRLFPDVATLFITIRSGCLATAKTVKVGPGANQPSFVELWDTLMAASGQGTHA
jgi:hypothetical protein